MEGSSANVIPRNQDFERTFLAYHGLMLSVARNIVGDDGLAEDAVSDALVNLYEHYDCLEAPIGPKTKRFIVVLTEHAAIDLLRKWKRERNVPLEDAGELRMPESDLEGHIDLMNAVNALPDPQRTAVLLCLACGLTVKEAALILNCSVSKAEKLVSRGKKTLRKKLKGEYA